MKIKKYRKGLTLIEIVISLAILAMIIGPILSLTLSSVKINKKSDDKLNALNLAQKRMEEIKFSSEGEAKDVISEKDGYIITKNIKIAENGLIGEYDPIKDDEVDVVIIIDKDTVTNVKYGGIDLSPQENEFITDGVLNIKLLQGNGKIILNGHELPGMVESDKEIQVKVNVTESKLGVNVLNYCKDKKLKLFFIENKPIEEESLLNLINFIGDIEHLTIYPTELKKENYNFYEISIKVEKKKGAEIEVLQELKGYKIIK